jgi:hypothetical protein
VLARVSEAYPRIAVGMALVIAVLVLVILVLVCKLYEMVPISAHPYIFTENVPPLFFSSTPLTH